MLTQLLPSRFQAHEEDGQRGRCRLSDQELEHQQNCYKMIVTKCFLLLSNPRYLRLGNFEPKEKVKFLKFLFVHF